MHTKKSTVAYRNVAFHWTTVELFHYFRYNRLRLNKIKKKFVLSSVYITFANAVAHKLYSVNV